MLGTIHKGLKKRLANLGIRRRFKTIKTKLWLEYREESWRPEETCYHSGIERTSADTGLKNSQRVKLG